MKEGGGREGGGREREGGGRREEGEGGRGGVKRNTVKAEMHTHSVVKSDTVQVSDLLACPPSRLPPCSIVLPNESVIKPGSGRVGG